jgi:hypothetical protein
LNSLKKYTKIFFHVVLKVTQVFLEPMHTIDGGIVPDLAKQIFGIGTKKHALKPHWRVLSKANRLVITWGSCTPYEFQRRLRNFSHIKRWKATEGRLFLLYFAPALYIAMGKQMADQFSLVMLLTLSMRLIGSDSVKPVPKVSHCVSISIVHLNVERGGGAVGTGCYA